MCQLYMHSFYYTICNIICVYIYIYDTLLIMFYNNILVFHMLYFIRYIFGIACSILHNSRICVEKHTHTHTHTHVYIYIYIYIYTHTFIHIQPGPCSFGSWKAPARACAAAVRAAGTREPVKSDRRTPFWRRLRVSGWGFGL